MVMLLLEEALFTSNQLLSFSPSITCPAWWCWMWNASSSKGVLS